MSPSATPTEAPFAAPSVAPSESPTECDRCVNEFTYECSDIDIFDGSSGNTFVPGISSFGVCSDPSPTITYSSVSCFLCDGSACPASEFAYEVNGNDLTVIRAPDLSFVTYTGSYFNGCRDKTFQCTASENFGSGTMFGRPQSPTEKLVNEIDSARWGWYQEIDAYPGGDLVYSFQMLAGAGSNVVERGVEVGYVEVMVKECVTGSEVSTAVWFIGTEDVCVVEDESQHHVHVGADYPRTGKNGGGKITFAPGRHTAGCCSAGETCIISVHGVVEEATCSVYGLCPV